MSDHIVWYVPNTGTETQNEAVTLAVANPYPDVVVFDSDQIPPGGLTRALLTIWQAGPCSRFGACAWFGRPIDEVVKELEQAMDEEINEHLLLCHLHGRIR